MKRFDSTAEKAGGAVQAAAGGAGAPPMPDSLKARYEKYKRTLKGLTIFHDIFMRNVFQKPECTEYVLRVIMGKQDLEVLEQVIQRDYKNLQGRSAFLDCVARDAGSTYYNVEIQQDPAGALPERARYHSGLLDTQLLQPGQEYRELPESYVIFITQTDVLGCGKPMYHVDRRIRESSRDFGDRSHIIYVNGENREDTELGRLMHDLHCQSADEMYSQVLAGRVRELKETQEGVTQMCDVMEELMEEVMGDFINEGREQGRAQTKRENAISMAAELGASAEQIAKIVKESVEVVREWLAEGTAAAK